MIDNKKLAVIHIVKKELGLTDQQYRDILEKTAGLWLADSPRDCSAGISSSSCSRVSSFIWVAPFHR